MDDTAIVHFLPLYCLWQNYEYWIYFIWKSEKIKIFWKHSKFSNRHKKFNFKKKLNIALVLQFNEYILQIDSDGAYLKECINSPKKKYAV